MPCSCHWHIPSRRMWPAGSRLCVADGYGFARDLHRWSTQIIPVKQGDVPAVCNSTRAIDDAICASDARCVGIGPRRRLETLIKRQSPPRLRQLPVNAQRFASWFVVLIKDVGRSNIKRHDNAFAPILGHISTNCDNSPIRLSSDVERRLAVPVISACAFRTWWCEHKLHSISEDRTVEATRDRAQGDCWLIQAVTPSSNAAARAVQRSAPR
jgi:hypothetical protein